MHVVYCRNCVTKVLVHFTLLYPLEVRIARVSALCLL